MIKAVTGARSISFARDNRGIAAMEFALCLPLLLLVFLGGYEVSQVMAVSRKLALATRSVADLTSQYSQLSSTDVQNVLNASAQVLAPYSSSTLGIVLSEIATDANGHSTIAWSQQLNAIALAPGTPVTVPAGVAPPNSFIIWCSTTYAYVPVITYFLSRNINLTNQIYMLPRVSSSIPLSN